MVKICISFLILIFTGCSNNNTENDDFDLFSETPLEKLAQLVRIQDTAAIAKEIISNSIDLETKERKYGNTILSLAVQNGKVHSVQYLLLFKANPNCTNNQGEAPLHLLQYAQANKNEIYQMCISLVSRFADVNKTNYKVEGADTTFVDVPLVGLSRYLDCGKLLIENKADPNFKYGNQYPVWFFRKVRSTDETVDFIYWLIVEKSIMPPEIIGYSRPNNKPIEFKLVLDKLKVRASKNEIEKIQRIQEILYSNK